MKQLVILMFFALVSCNAFAFKMLCRGPLEIVNRYPGVILGPIAIFKKNPTSSGADGERLNRGSCAWLDRRISTNEPNKLLIGVGSRETSAPWSFEYLYFLIMRDHNKQKIVRERLDYLTRSNYVVEFDVIQNTSESVPFFAILGVDEFRDDAYLRLIPFPK